MKIVEKAIDEIRPYEQNPRQNDQAADATKPTRLLRTGSACIETR